MDSYTLLNFGVYASFMTGNTTSAGLHAGHAKLAASGHSLLPIPFFVLGILMGTLLVQASPHHELPRHSLLVAALLTVGTAATYFAWPGWLSIMILSTAMGILNTSITHAGGQAVNLGFVTGDLNNLGQHLLMGFKRVPVQQTQGSWDTHWRRAALLAGIWIPSSLEPCSEQHWGLASRCGPCCCPSSCYWLSLCWNAALLQTLGWDKRFSRNPFHSRAGLVTKPDLCGSGLPTFFASSRVQQLKLCDSGYLREPVATRNLSKC